MLLDHNTTVEVAWITQADYKQTESKTATPSEVGLTYASENMTNGLPTGTWRSSGINNRGPITLLNQLKNDTSNWVVAENLTDSDSYTAEWSNSYNYYSGNQKYTINYNGYKARVLSAEEINEITGKGTNTLSNIKTDYFDTNCSSSGTCSAGTNNYSWLFDYVINCTSYGCNIGTNSYPWGYWTMSPVASNYSPAWIVDYKGNLTGSGASTTSYGVRPVIKVSKDKLSVNS